MHSIMCNDRAIRTKSLRICYHHLKGPKRYSFRLSTVNTLAHWRKTHARSLHPLRRTNRHSSLANSNNNLKTPWLKPLTAQLRNSKSSTRSFMPHRQINKRRQIRIL